MNEGRELRKRRERELKARDKAKLRELSQRLKHARAARPHRIREIRGLCRIGRQNLKARLRALRAETLAELRETAKRLRDEQRGECQTSSSAARENLTKAIDAAHTELADARRQFRSFYGRKSSGGVSGRQRATERRQESDDEVIRNLPPELVPVFRKVRGKIKAGPRRTRTEAFLEWVESNTDEAHAIVFDQVEADVSRMVREHEQISKRLRKSRAYEDPEAAAHALGAVPF